MNIRAVHQQVQNSNVSRKEALVAEFHLRRLISEEVRTLRRRRIQELRQHSGPEAFGQQGLDGVRRDRVTLRGHSSDISSNDLLEQPFGLLFEGNDVGADLFQSAQGLRLVEVAGEADLVTGLDAV